MVSHAKYKCNVFTETSMERPVYNNHDIAFCMLSKLSLKQITHVLRSENIKVHKFESLKNSLKI